MSNIRTQQLRFDVPDDSPFGQLSTGDQVRVLKGILRQLGCSLRELSAYTPRLIGRDWTRIAHRENGHLWVNVDGDDDVDLTIEEEALYIGLLAGLGVDVPNPIEDAIEDAIESDPELIGRIDAAAQEADNELNSFSNGDRPEDMQGSMQVEASTPDVVPTTPAEITHDSDLDPLRTTSVSSSSNNSASMGDSYSSDSGGSYDSDSGGYDD